MKSFKYLMFEHGGSDNHGCEAIVRSTVNMLGNENRYYLQTLNPESDKKFGLDKHIKLLTSSNADIRESSPLGLFLRFKSRLPHEPDFDVQQSIYRHRKMLIKGACALSVGGDNYCYSSIIHSMRDKLAALNTKNIPVVLWGCSVNPESLSGSVINDLDKYSLITARESLTAELLENSGFGKKTVLCSDPAFTLPIEETNWNNEAFKNNLVIGINISGFMSFYEKYDNATFINFKTLIEYLLKNTDSYIALIPHVRQPGNNDLEISKKLANEINSDRILLLQRDLNCMQIKNIISKCDMFIGCRTHSTIAAYSTCVPTLVAGYSTKAKGIAKDIFGDYSDLLVDVREFKSDNDLLNKFLIFNERKDELKAHLQAFMPRYISRAYLAKDALERIL